MKEINEKEMFAGLYLAKFDKEGIKQLGFSTLKDTLASLAKCVGGKASSIKNYRDEFSPAFPDNHKQGWHKRPMRKTRVDMLQHYGNLGLNEMTEMLQEMFVGIDEYLDKLEKVFINGSSGEEIAKKAVSIDIVQQDSFFPPMLDWTTVEGRERIAQVKVRVSQKQFRNWMLALYDSKCCITGISLPQVLCASHIVGWGKDSFQRMNPENGLCLSATHHLAFDNYLLSFDEDYRVVLSSALREYYTNQAFKDFFQRYEGHHISLPHKYLPSKTFLELHRNHLAN